MRLIILNTDPLTEPGQKGFFEGIFNEEIIVEPESKIALQSVSVNRALEFLVVDTTTNKIRFQIQAANAGGFGGLHTIDMNEKTYSRKNILEFFTEMVFRFHQKLSIDAGNEFGTQISAGINSKNFVSVEFKRQPRLQFSQDQDADLKISNGLIFNTVQLRRTISAQVSGATLESNFVASRIDWVKGCGVLRMRLNQFVNANGGVPAGAVIGLVPNTSENQDKLSNNTITVDDLEFAIRTNSDNLTASNYQMKFIGGGAGGYLDAGIAPHKATNDATYTDNDIIDIVLELGTIAGYIRQHTNSGGVEKTEIFRYTLTTAEDQNKKYLPILGVFGANTTTRIGLASASLDPFDSQNISLSPDAPHDETLGAVVKPTQSFNPQISNLIWPTLDMANYFGFDAVNQNPLLLPSPTTGQAYTAGGSFARVISLNTYLIELLNLQVDSFHGLAQGRKNILAAVPVSENIMSDSGQIQYEPNNLFFVDLKNKFPITLRNISARIIGNDFSEIETEGLAEIAILIKNKDE